MARSLFHDARMNLARSLLTVAVAVVAIAAAGCGGDDNQPSGSGSGGAGGGGGTAGSGGGTGGTGGSDGCPAGSHPAGGGCEATLSKWAATSPLVFGRDHHVTFATHTKAGDFLYVAGGINAVSIFNDVVRAPIQADGTLGAWGDAGATLPEGTAGSGLAQVGNNVVMAGGLVIDGSTAVSGKDTFVGIVADDGGIAFHKGPKLLTDRYHVSLSVDRGYVYAIGGLRQFYTGGQPMQEISDAVERAPFDGKTLGDFEALDPLPHELTHQAAVVRNHSIYLVGGLEGQTVITDVLRADLDEKGKPSAWTKAGALSLPRATAAAFIFLDKLYVICGADEAQGGEVATVLRAPFEKNGSVGAFEAVLPSVPKARAHVHQTPVVNGFIYSAGGSAAAMYEPEVFVGALK